MHMVLLRVGIDTGSGGIHGPLFPNGDFEFIPIPDRFGRTGVDTRTYGNTKARHGRPLIQYFPDRLRNKMRNQPMHVDPDFETFTYGDPTPPKRSLRQLQRGDLLVFYAGLEGWGFECEPALYIVGYFEVAAAGFASNFSADELKSLFAENFHVRHRRVFEDQKGRLLLVKGGRTSRLLKKAVLISSIGRDRSGRPLKVLSPAMRRVFGDFRGKVSIQRSPPRWVEARFVERAAKFVRQLE